MTREQFLIAFPEFGGTATTIVDKALTDALPNVDAAVWGGNYDRGHGLYAAHLLAMSPQGRTARLAAPADGTTTYLVLWEELKDKSTVMLRVF